MQETRLILGLPVLRQGQNFLLLRPVTVVSFCRGTAILMQVVTHADDADVHAKLGARLGYCHPLCPEAPALWQMRKPSARLREPSYREHRQSECGGLCCRKYAQEEAAQVFITDTLLTTLMCTHT